ncbi:YceI family protein [Xanthovirga aplysinae]|uniref:YceI family protein n=1 Tax=Xanthovirga aplysinae TaxID=2529853 RepID=UPI0012BD0B72|nr:YceI family protein [Xanthovirga aplysinae]MTI29994.1 polyisoprenoid-binding protein [Xanthovirga aplysinae]
MKKVTFILTALLLSITSLSFAQKAKWETEPDGAHSHIGFDIDHLVISSVSGEFKDYKVTILSGKDDFTDAEFNVEIKVPSITTENEKRDGHLKSPDFFDAAQFELITFKGTKIEKVGKNKYKITGDLTIKDVTKTVTLDAKLNGVLNDPNWGSRAGFKVSGVIDRTDFGLNFNSILENGGMLIGEEVRLNINLELVKGV